MKSSIVGLHSSNSVQHIMFSVCIAMMPALIVNIFFFGQEVLINLFIALIFGLILELFILHLRGYKNKLNTIKDGSVLVTSIIIALSLPTNIGIGLILIAMVFSIVIAKHLFGGLGYNLFNPAMVGYAVLLLSFPSEMNQWADPIPLDSISGATPLDQIYSQLTQENIAQGNVVVNIYDNLTSFDLLSITSLIDALKNSYFQYLFILQVAYLIGGLYLLFRKIIPWSLPIFFLSSSLLWAYLADIFIEDSLPFYLQMISGSLFFAAFFIITDPVTSPMSTTGKVVFAIIASSITFLIRSFSIYPEGVAFAIIISNFLVPSIDLIFRNKIYGERFF